MWETSFGTVCLWGPDLTVMGSSFFFSVTIHLVPALERIPLQVEDREGLETLEMGH